MEKITILIVDDESAFVWSLKEGLDSEYSNMRVLTAQNGNEAIEKLSKDKIDLLLLDLRMPKVDGYGVLDHLKKYSLNIPVIVMSAYNTPLRLKHLESLGVHYYLEKPVDFNILISTINQALGLKYTT